MSDYADQAEQYEERRNIRCGKEAGQLARQLHVIADQVEYAEDADEFKKALAALMTALFDGEDIATRWVEAYQPGTVG